MHYVILRELETEESQKTDSSPDKQIKHIGLRMTIMLLTKKYSNANEIKTISCIFHIFIELCLQPNR